MWKGILISLAALLAAGSGGGGIYLKLQADTDTFFDQTVINGFDASGKTPEEVLQLLKTEFGSSSFTLEEKDEPVLTGTFPDFGYVIDEQVQLELLQEAHKIQRSDIEMLIKSLFYGTKFSVEIPVTVNNDQFTAAVNAAALSVPRIASQNAEMVFDEASGSYAIIPETNGTEFEDAVLQQLVHTQLDLAASGKLPPAELSYDIPEDIYLKPAITKDDAALNSVASIYNSYCHAEITYTFGNQTQVLGWQVIKDWIDPDSGSISDASVRSYIEDLAGRWNTRYHDRLFTTTFGNTITIPGSINEYGYTVNEDAEVEQLKADIRSNTSVARDPVYYYTNSYGNPYFLGRDGYNDMAGTYVEVSLSAQHLWFYKNYQLFFESDVVTGNASTGTTTTPGCYPLAYKESPSVLRGADANGGYETPVTYWMPFHEGQGMHDATWRGSFGGNIYQYSGSHGCVNLPYYAAETIYNNISSGTAIVIY